MTLNRKKEIELLAIKILMKYQINENPGRRIKEIVSGEKIELIDYHEWSEEICGRFMCINDIPVIYYNAKHTEHMQVFTIAHELGHYFLNHLDDTEPETVCLDRDFERLDDSVNERAKKEVEANFFAACLLLPFHLLKPVFDEFMDWNGRTGVLYVDRQQCNFLDYKSCIRRMKLYFFASESAIRYRLINLGWMDFRIEFSPTEDRGISIAKYLKKMETSM